MADKPLAGRTIAIMLANGFDEVEFTEPQKKLIEATSELGGISMMQVAPEQGQGSEAVIQQMPDFPRLIGGHPRPHHQGGTGRFEGPQAGATEVDPVRGEARIRGMHPDTVPASDFPQPWTPTSRMPRGAARPSLRAFSPNPVRARASQSFRRSKPPSSKWLSSAG